LLLFAPQRHAFASVRSVLGLLVTGAQSQVTGLLKGIFIHPVINHGNPAAFHVFFTP
jgi:hypothetical protein